MVSPPSLLNALPTPDVVLSKSFEGSRGNMIFTTRGGKTGYYADNGALPASPSVAALGTIGSFELSTLRNAWRSMSAALAEKESMTIKPVVNRARSGHDGVSTHFRWLCRVPLHLNYGGGQVSRRWSVSARSWNAC